MLQSLIIELTSWIRPTIRHTFIQKQLSLKYLPNQDTYINLNSMLTYNRRKKKNVQNNVSYKYICMHAMLYNALILHTLQQERSMLTILYNFVLYTVLYC